jgi:hypothetical protein
VLPRCELYSKFTLHSCQKFHFSCFLFFEHAPLRSAAQRKSVKWLFQPLSSATGTVCSLSPRITASNRSPFIFLFLLKMSTYAYLYCMCMHVHVTPRIFYFFWHHLHSYKKFIVRPRHLFLHPTKSCFDQFYTLAFFISIEPIYRISFVYLSSFYDCVDIH